MNRSMWFNVYLIFAILVGVSVELINYFNESVAGIGFVIYWLTIISFYQILGRKK